MFTKGDKKSKISSKLLKNAISKQVSRIDASSIPVSLKNRVQSPDSSTTVSVCSTTVSTASATATKVSTSVSLNKPLTAKPMVIIPSTSVPSSTKPTTTTVSKKKNLSIPQSNINTVVVPHDPIQIVTTQKVSNSVKPKTVIQVNSAKPQPKSLKIGPETTIQTKTIADITALRKQVLEKLSTKHGHDEIKNLQMTGQLNDLLQKAVAKSSASRLTPLNITSSGKSSSVIIIDDEPIAESPVPRSQNSPITIKTTPSSQNCPVTSKVSPNPQNALSTPKAVPSSQNSVTMVKTPPNSQSSPRATNATPNSQNSPGASKASPSPQSSVSTSNISPKSQNPPGTPKGTPSPQNCPSILKEPPNSINPSATPKTTHISQNPPAAINVSASSQKLPETSKLDTTPSKCTVSVSHSTPQTITSPKVRMKQNPHTTKSSNGPLTGTLSDILNDHSKTNNQTIQLSALKSFRDAVAKIPGLTSLESPVDDTDKGEKSDKT